MKGYHARSKKENKEVQAILILFLVVVNILTLIFTASIIYIYFKTAKVSFPFFPYSLYSLFIPYFMVISQFLWIRYKMEKKGFSYFLIHSAITILSISLGLFFVVKMQWGASGRMGSILIAQAAIGILAFKALFQNLKIDLKVVKDALKLGWPLVIAAILRFPTQNIDKVFLEKQNDIFNFGLYNIGLQMAGYLMVMGSALFQAFEPDFFKFASRKKTDKFALSALFVFGFLLVANLIFLVASKPIIAFLTSNRYTGAYKYANLAIWGNFILMLTFLLGIILISMNKTKLILYVRVVLAIIALFVFEGFIAKWSFNGALYAKILINSINVLFYLGIILFFRSKKYRLVKNE